LKNNSGEQIQNIAAATPLAIVGIGCLFPQAADKGTFWTNIKNGTDAIIEVPETHWRSDDYFDTDPKSPDKVYAKYGGFLSPVDFNPMEYGVLPNALEAIDTSQLLGLVAVDQALQDAGYTTEKTFDRDRVSVIIGVTGTLELVVPLGARLGHPRWREALKDAGIADNIAEDVMARISDSYVPWQENSFPGLLGNVVAGRISKHFNFGGTNCVVDAACGSSLSALNLAALELAAGKSDMVVTGGIDTFNDIFMYTCFSKTPALSPDGHAKPFSDNADGTTLGEGLGIVVIKRLADAERDGDKIYAVVKGIGASSDGRAGAIYEPSAIGQQKALRRAYEQGGVDPQTIELIEAHGTGTKVGDAVEVTALKEIFGDATSPWCALGSIKSQIGHTKAAAGSAGLIKAAMALYNKTLPPTIKVDKPQETVTATGSPFYVNTEARPWIPRGDHPRRAGVSALGFGGSNFHCLLEEHRSGKVAADWQGDVQLVTFSAVDENGLKTHLENFPADASWNEIRLAADQSRSRFDTEQPCRLTLVLEKEKSKPAAQIKTALTMLNTNRNQNSWNTPDGTFFAKGDIDGDLAMLFPGQGAQYPNMLKDLAIQFPQFLESFKTADHAFATNTGGSQGRLADFVYPRPVFNQTDREKNVADLQATDVAQPALGAVSLGARDVLASFGITATAYAGHSYGELTALCCGGYFKVDALHELSRLRGELMAAGAGDRGSMLAVSAPLDQVETFLKESKLKLVLANRNTPEQGVLSGATAEIEKAATLLDDQGLRYKQLSVAAAFHSELVADASEPFGKRLQSVKFSKPTASVYANTTGKTYPKTAKEARKLLTAQLASPVDFIAEIESMYAAGMRTFIEVGPGARMTGMVKAILGARDHQTIAIDASNGKRSGIADLGRALAQLTVLGYPVELSAWDEGFATRYAALQIKKPGMTIPLTGANYFKRPAKRPPVAAQVTTSPTVVPATAQSATIQQPTPTANPTAPTANSGSLQEALQITRQSMQALQNLQEQTARLHQQFLTGQEAATTSFLNLVNQQNSLIQGQPIPAAVPPIQQPQPDPPIATPPQATTQTPQPIAEPVVPPAPVAVPAVDTNRVATVLLSVIAEKTGYPEEMLDLEMSLDADLGIDSIKRVEILSALQEKLPDAPAVKPEDLGRLQTLGQIIDHLTAGMTTTPAATAVVPTTSSRVDNDQVAQILLAIIAEKTGYPIEMLELEMSLDADLGIDSIKRVEILSTLQEKLPDAPAVKPEDLGRLQTLGQIIGHLTAGMATPPGANVSVPTAVPAIDSSRISSVLLEVIAEKTGYPIEMLEMEMALDTDLGIDSIKRVEILSALQEKLPEAPAVKPEDLGVLQTLGQIVDHLSAGMTAPTTVEAVTTQTAVADSNQISSVLLDVIAEKTGYPIEMLEMEMALDTDLGIDSIKRVEILSALQEKLPDAPAVKPEDLGVLQTLGQIVEYLSATAQKSVAPISPAPLTGQLDRESVSTTLLEVISAKTGYPTEMLELEMALDTDLGIDSIKRVEILSSLQEKLPDAPAIKPEHLGTLQTVGHIVEFLTSVSGVSKPDAKAEAQVERPSISSGIDRQVLKAVPLQKNQNYDAIKLPQDAIIWINNDGSELTSAICQSLTEQNLTAEIIDLDRIDKLTPSTNLAGLILLTPQTGADDRFIQNAFRLMQLAEPALNLTGDKSGAILATVSRLNGRFAIAEGGPVTNALSGGLAGLVKTAGHEWKDVYCKAFDLSAEQKDIASTAQRLVTELLLDGPQEIGFTNDGMFALELAKETLTENRLEPPVSYGDVVAISGGARGVTAEVAVSLAAASKATLLLLGRSAMPTAEPDWLNSLSDEAEIKKGLIANAQTQLKPKEVGQQCQAIFGNREIRTTLQRIKEAGGQALYRSVDLRDADAVAAVISDVREEYGPIKGLIHGAGVLADRLIKDKTIEQFDQVYTTKIDGLRNLLKAVGNDALNFMVMFSSSTGRFGRTGQVDYAVANEILNKLAQEQAGLRPDCRVLSLNWGPWDGGMVTPALKKLFAAEGIAVIDLKTGSDYLVKEISTPPGGPVELVILGGSEALASKKTATQMQENICVSRALDLDVTIDHFPFLKSHVIDGKAVLPVAVIVEWMAHGAIHNNPGLRFHGFNDLRILKGVILEQGETHTLQVMTGKAFKSDGLHVVPVELTGTGADGQQFVHSRARMVLAGKLPEIKPAMPRLEMPAYARNISEIYQPDRLFHGSDFQGIREVIGCSDEGIASVVRPAPLPAEWIKQPLRTAWLSDPLALDCSFQMMILWSFERYKAGSLPVFAGRYRQYQDSFPASGAEIRVQVTNQNANKATAQIDFIDPATGSLVARIEDYECIIDASLNASFQRNKLQGVA
jgi:acyl transferase domain-containing protein